MVLTVRGIGWGSGAAASASCSGGGVRDGDRRRVAAEVLPASGSFGSTRDGAAKWYRGSGMLGTRRRRANGAAVHLPAAGGSVPSVDVVVVAPRFWAARSGRVRHREGSRGQLKAARHPGRACTRYPRRQSRQRRNRITATVLVRSGSCGGSF